MIADACKSTHEKQKDPQFEANLLLGLEGWHYMFHIFLLW